MSLETETAMLEFAASLNYLVVFPDKSHKLFKSLRDIEGDICVNASTISKKLKYSPRCVCTARGTGYVFWVCKL
jgi:hypothetical protein